MIEFIWCYGFVRVLANLSIGEFSTLFFLCLTSILIIFDIFKFNKMSSGEWKRWQQKQRKFIVVHFNYSQTSFPLTFSLSLTRYGVEILLFIFSTRFTSSFTSFTSPPHPIPTFKRHNNSLLLLEHFRGLLIIRTYMYVYEFLGKKDEIFVHDLN